VIHSIVGVAEAVNWLNAYTPEGDDYFAEARSFMDDLGEFVTKINTGDWTITADTQAIFDKVKEIVDNINDLSSQLKGNVDKVIGQLNRLNQGQYNVSNVVRSTNSLIVGSYRSTASSVVSYIDRMINKVNQFKAVVSSNLFAGGTAGGVIGDIGTVIGKLFAGNVSSGVKYGQITTNNSRSNPARNSNSGLFAGSENPRVYAPKNSTIKTDEEWFLRNMLSCTDCPPSGFFAGYPDDLSPNYQEVRSNVSFWNTRFKPSYWNWGTKAGDFEYSNFPFTGKSNIAEAYILDMIGRTNYQFYYNSKGGSLADIYSSGSFNCDDGSRIMMAWADKFGLANHKKTGYWGDTPHSWAWIQGIGDIDATAIQNGYGKFAYGKVHAGPTPKSPPSGAVNNNGDNGDTNVTININSPIYGVDQLEEVIKNAAKQAIRENNEKYLIKNSNSNGF
jgi:hypothetical protein